MEPITVLEPIPLVDSIPAVEPIPVVDPIPVIPILAHLVVIPSQIPTPAKNGIKTPLILAIHVTHEHFSCHPRCTLGWNSTDLPQNLGLG